MLKQQELTYTYCFISFSMKFRSFSNEQQQQQIKKNSRGFQEVYQYNQNGKT